jgi:nucleoside-diphosphate-sugar epimerase
MGCGWLGFPLAQFLIKEGYEVLGTTTSKDKLTILEKAGIVPFLISISERHIRGQIAELLRNAETLIINIPPKLRGTNRENYVQKMALLRQAIIESKTHNIVFISSTSVYGDIQGKVNEEITPKPTTESGKQLLSSEKLFQDIPNVETTIIRFGGLIGEDRHPINMLSGKKDLLNANHPVNLIHLDDCITLIESVIRRHWLGEVFHAVYPLHPTKEKYYRQIATERGMIPPEYDQNSKSSGKIIDSGKLISVKKFGFKTSIFE